MPSHDHATTAITTNSAMTIVIINLLNFLIFTVFTLVQIPDLCGAVKFPIVPNEGKTRLRQSFRLFNTANWTTQMRRNLTIHKSKQFGVVTSRKSAGERVPSFVSINGRASKDYQPSNLTILKNREFLEIRRKNPLESKLSYGTDKLSLRETETGNKPLFSQLSSLVRSAADVMNLFQKVATRERATPFERSVRRRHSMRQLSRAVQPGRRSLPMVSLAQANLHDAPNLQKDDFQNKPRTLEDTAWGELLFGPRGVLTAVFHILDDRRKIIEKPSSGSTVINKSNKESNSQTTDNYHQSDLSLLPDFLINAKPIDFAKIFEAFLTGSNGDFDERISNLPEILGICNRLSCGDIYKAIDEFRKSEFFTNFQTALQLIQDPKGWEILGDLISNPDLIAQFMNGAGANGGAAGIGLENLFGSITGSKKLLKNNSKEIDAGDGDIGIDFSKMVDGSVSGAGGELKKLKKPTSEELPEIAENIDAIDYYNAVESGTDIDGIETVTKPDIIAITITSTMLPSIGSISTQTTASSIWTRIVSRPQPVIPDLSLPEIAENIDESEQTKIIIDATIPPPARIWRKFTPAFNRQNITAIPPLPKRLYFTVTYRPVTTTTIAHKQVITGSNRTMTYYPTRSTSIRTTTRATTKNFREESDYYAMYYDDMTG